MNLPKTMIEFATRYVHKKSLKLLRLDADASKEKLMKIYEDLDFRLMGIDQEKDRSTAFFEKGV